MSHPTACSGRRCAPPLKASVRPCIGKNGLVETSYALIDQVRSVDKRRVRRVFGRITKDELAAVDQGLEIFLGLAPEP